MTVSIREIEKAAEAIAAERKRWNIQRATGPQDLWMIVRTPNLERPNGNLPIIGESLEHRRFTTEAAARRIVRNRCIVAAFNAIGLSCEVE